MLHCAIRYFLQMFHFRTLRSNETMEVSHKSFSVFSSTMIHLADNTEIFIASTFDCKCGGSVRK